MSQKNDMAKKIVKKKITQAIISASTPLIIAFLVILVISVVISSLLNYVFNLDGTVNEGDKSNVPFVAEDFSTEVTISPDGTINSNTSAQEIWDTIKDNGGRLDEYLEKPEQLQKLIQAEAVTDFLDTRPNPDAPIDWDKILNNPDSTEIQGIIKLKRATSDGNTFTMIYTDPDTFQSYIDTYNETGSESDKQMALRYFTIERGYTTAYGGDYEIGTDGIAKAIEKGDVVYIPQGQGYGTTYTYNSWQLIGGGTQLKLREQAGMTFDEEGFGRINGRYTVATKDTFGKVGDYIDYYYIDKNGVEQMIPCIICDIKGSDAPNPYGHHGGKNIIEFYVNEVTWCTPNWNSVHEWYQECGQASSMHVNPGTNGFHEEWQGAATKVVNGGNYFDDPDFKEEQIEEDKSNLMVWPTDGTQITSTFGNREAPTEGASTNHGGIDIGVGVGTDIYAAEAGTVIFAGDNSSAGIEVRIDHGNGYVTRYLHNSATKVKVGDIVEKGQVIALSGNTGVSTGPHLHFEVQYNGQKVDPLSFEYQNGMGGSGLGIGANAGASSFGDKYYAKVATWNEQTYTLISSDPDVEQYEKVNHNMTTTDIDYQELVSGFTMPFEYLWDFLLIGEDKDFVLELADLVYESEIEITVHDNLAVNTNISTENYTKKTMVITDSVVVKVEYEDVIEDDDDEDDDEDDNDDEENDDEPETTSGNEQVISEQLGPKEISNNYTTIRTVVDTTNTLDVSLTKADVWFVEYIKDYTYQIADNVVTNSPTEYPDDIPYSGTYGNSDGKDTAGLAEEFRKSVENDYARVHTSASASIISLRSTYDYATVNKTIDVENTLESAKYVPCLPTIREKIDPNSTEPNFVTIYQKEKYERNAGNIYSGHDWLFQMLENNEDTKDMVDLTKYLLAKAIEQDGAFGVSEMDPSLFN